MNKEFTITQADFSMTLDVRLINKDFLFTITGGDVPHIGTITTRTENGQVESVIFPSPSGGMHKDVVLAELLLEKITSFIDGNIVITSGVHVDKILKEQINAAFEMINWLADEFLEWLKENPVQFVQPKYKKLEN
ncbi:MAG: amino acid decarboxylase [Streptococcaceae bacterium]|jgi:hypothetical protein|nr:amino acid decarboxylase [Streptococcaceae bacterium]